jgi:hypothetical protein
MIMNNNTSAVVHSFELLGTCEATGNEVQSMTGGFQRCRREATRCSGSKRRQRSLHIPQPGIQEIMGFGGCHQ